ncbi:MAG: TRAP transporter large permease subunit, partial [Hyphomicrobiaceae bacterium]
SFVTLSLGTAYRSFGGEVRSSTNPTICRLHRFTPSPTSGDSSLSFGSVWSAAVDTVMMTGAVMIIIMASSVIQWILTAERIPQGLAAWVTGSITQPWLVILALNIVMLIVGCFLDLPAAILLLGPLFVTIGKAIGLDLVQLGLMMVVNLSIGLYTPPVGTTLFISAAIARCGIGEVVRALLPFYLVALLVLALISYLPALTIY